MAFKFTDERVDDKAAEELAKVYKKAIERLTAAFSMFTDIKKSRQMALLTFISFELKALGKTTQTWLDENIPKAYRDGMRAAVNGMDALIADDLLPKSAIQVG